MRFARASLSAIVYFSVATLLAELAVLGVLWSQGRLNRDSLLQLMSIAYDVDWNEMGKKRQARGQFTRGPQVSHQEVVARRTKRNLELDLREMAVSKGLQGLGQLQSSLDRQRSQYDELIDTFERRLEQLRQEAEDEGVRDVQRQLESARSRLAKDQIVRILEDDSLESDASLDFVVTVLKGMPLGKRKKILAEFKDEETAWLHEILRQIRLGAPDMDLIQQTRKQLKQFDSRR